MSSQTESLAENLAIVAVVGGVFCPLYYRADDGVTEHIRDTGDALAFNDSEHDLLGDGVWVVSLAFAVAGLGDAGVDEVDLKLSSPRSPTTNEWLAYVGDEHVWSTP